MQDLSPVKQGYLQQGLIELVPDDLPAPILPDQPGQLERGQLKYYQVCLACHGNWGQGLTDEWRATGFGDDMNCWQSKCHAPNHPPHGFEIPKEMPPLLGITALSTLANAEQLYQIIYQSMPWWDPGALTSQEAVDLTAYLMNARGELPDGIELTKDNLAAFPLHGQPVELVNANLGGIILISGLSIAMASYIWTKKSSKKFEQ
ncbi:MAG: hypothetical protein JW757_12585 [Anaerolineales bacterium]|nr:hypothetical protein [Anaerolineales bacterium]